MANSVGLIDIDYRGELKAPMYNHTNEPIYIKKGTSLFQLVTPSYQPSIAIILDTDNLELLLNETTRGDGGFGSTGNTHV